MELVDLLRSGLLGVCAIWPMSIGFAFNDDGNLSRNDVGLEAALELKELEARTFDLAGARSLSDERADVESVEDFRDLINIEVADPRSTGFEGVFMELLKDDVAAERSAEVEGIFIELLKDDVDEERSADLEGVFIALVKDDVAAGRSADVEGIFIELLLKDDIDEERSADFEGVFIALVKDDACEWRSTDFEGDFKSSLERCGVDAAGLTGLLELDFEWSLRKGAAFKMLEPSAALCNSAFAAFMACSNFLSFRSFDASAALVFELSELARIVDFALFAAFFILEVSNFSLVESGLAKS